MRSLALNVQDMHDWSMYPHTLMGFMGLGQKNIGVGAHMWPNIFFTSRIPEFAFLFFQLLWTYLSKYTIGQQTSWTLGSDLYILSLVSCSSKNQVPYLILDEGCDWLKLDISAGGIQKTKIHLVPGFSIYLKLWDIFFFSCIIPHFLLPSLCFMFQG